MSDTEKVPEVVWEGKNPNGNEQFRIVFRPQVPAGHPAHVLEIRKGHDAMNVERWGHVGNGGMWAAICALMDDVLKPSRLFNLLMDVRIAREDYPAFTLDEYADVLQGKSPLGGWPSITEENPHA